MGIISWLKDVSAGKTARQTENRYDRANKRAVDYMSVVQWYVEEADYDNPLVLQNYAELYQQNFRPGHKAVLAGYRNDIERKLGHAANIGTKQNPWIAAFLRPREDTVFCAYVLLRDDQQQFAVVKPYWFLSGGEKPENFKKDVMGYM